MPQSQVQYGHPNKMVTSLRTKLWDFFCFVFAISNLLLSHPLLIDETVVSAVHWPVT